MNLFIIGNVLYIREIGKEEAGEDVHISLPGVADGTDIIVFRTADGKFQIARFKDGVASFGRSFFADSRYRIEIKLPSGEFLSCAFECKDGRLCRLWRGKEAEIAELWSALIYLVESREEKDAKVDRLVEGYTSE